MRRTQHNAARGISMIETIIAIGIVATILIVVLSIQNVVQLQQNAYYRTVARQLILEESESLRNASFADLHNRTNTGFIEVAYNIGSWSVQQPSGAQSGTRVFMVQNVSGSTNPSRQVVPAGNLGDGTAEAYFRIQNGAPAGWKAGVYFRYHDSQNYYLVQASGTTLTLSKVVEGTPTQLGTWSNFFSKNIWYRLTIVAAGSDLAVSVDGTPRISSTDATFSRGQFVLGAFDGAIAEFDTLSFVGATTTAWNFDGANETVGATAYGWHRAGPTDLPGGTTAITITDAQGGYTDLKQVALTVTWNERNGQRSLSNTFYINQQSVAP